MEMVVSRMAHKSLPAINPYLQRRDHFILICFCRI